jgi:hypothetical protein
LKILQRQTQQKKNNLKNSNKEVQIRFQRLQTSKHQTTTTISQRSMFFIIFNTKHQQSLKDQMLFISNTKHQQSLKHQCCSSSSPNNNQPPQKNEKSQGFLFFLQHRTTISLEQTNNHKQKATHTHTQIGIPQLEVQNEKK